MTMTMTTIVTITITITNDNSNDIKHNNNSNNINTSLYRKPAVSVSIYMNRIKNERCVELEIEVPRDEAEAVP